MQLMGRTYNKSKTTALGTDCVALADIGLGLDRGAPRGQQGGATKCPEVKLGWIGGLLCLWPAPSGWSRGLKYGGDPSGPGPAVARVVVDERQPSGSGHPAPRLGWTPAEGGGFDSPTTPKLTWTRRPPGERSAPERLKIGAGGTWEDWGQARPDRPVRTPRVPVPETYLEQTALGRTELRSPGECLRSSAGGAWAEWGRGPTLRQIAGRTESLEGAADVGLCPPSVR
ncbi:hypothetical protein NDU88_001912 [Pleurodeles waltl]|uniref:Uncharacterized protein n=1 Tax=Pleurodeles waltl TaxID=8319 RepID=A0AAV7NC35_PLEWA|nr:hypothetical protein NDU88_001912 [Pleurodeles waltl]